MWCTVIPTQIFWHGWWPTSGFRGAISPLIWSNLPGMLHFGTHQLEDQPRINSNLNPDLKHDQSVYLLIDWLIWFDLFCFDLIWLIDWLIEMIDCLIDWLIYSCIYLLLCFFFIFCCSCTRCYSWMTELWWYIFACMCVSTKFTSKLYA